MDGVDVVGLNKLRSLKIGFECRDLLGICQESTVNARQQLAYDRLIGG